MKFIGKEETGMSTASKITTNTVWYIFFIPVKWKKEIRDRNGKVLNNEIFSLFNFGNNIQQNGG